MLDVVPFACRAGMRLDPILVLRKILEKLGRDDGTYHALIISEIDELDERSHPIALPHFIGRSMSSKARQPVAPCAVAAVTTGAESKTVRVRIFHARTQTFGAAGEMLFGPCEKRLRELDAPFAVSGGDEFPIGGDIQAHASSNLS